MLFLDLQSSPLSQSVPLRVAVTAIILYTVHLLIGIVRNLYLSPLSKYSGPKLWAISHLPNYYYIYKGLRVYKVAGFHDKYGPVVRISPTELSFIDEAAWKDIYSPHKDGQLKKDLIPPTNRLIVSDIFSQPDDQTHARMRKKLAPAFSEKSLREREGTLQKFSDNLIVRLKDAAGKAENVLHWYDCTTSDITGELVFGESFHCLDTGEIHPIIPNQAKLLENRPINRIWYKEPVLRLLRNFWRTPQYLNFFRKIVGEKMQQRGARLAASKIEDGVVPDFMAVLASGHGALPIEECNAIGVDLLVAGSDTVATALSATTYFLGQNPEKLQRLQDEIRATFKDSGDITLESVSRLKYQNAVLSETLRLIPATPESTRRITGPNGCIIRGKFVPPGIAVGVFHWAAGHSSWSWKDPESFVPERWLGDEKYSDDKRGVVQFFNTGPRNCVGQNLAWAEMRLILAKIVFHFDIELSEESKDWKDMPAYGLAWVKRPLMVKMTSVR